MARQASTAFPASCEALIQTFAGPATLAEGLAEVQRIQFEALARMCEAFTSFNKELFDDWACRWAGGVPIDA
jgi:hypothetical protein